MIGNSQLSDAKKLLFISLIAEFASIRNAQVVLASSGENGASFSTKQTIHG
jgi:hypothetical protein